MSNSNLSTKTDKINHFYQEYVRKYGISAGWSTKQSAENAYRAASSYSDQHWHDFESVLDVGSGDGHFLSFLRSHCGFRGQYTGIELLSFFYENAVDFYGRQDGVEFIHADFLNYEFGVKKFDWVFSLGSLAVKQEQQEERNLTVCRKMISLAKYGLSIYLNDTHQMAQEKRDGVLGLATHEVGIFTSMLKQECDVANIEVIHYPLSSSQDTMIHLTL